MSGRGVPPEADDSVVLIGVVEPGDTGIGIGTGIGTATGTDGDDGLDLGPPPRAPLAARTRRRLVAGGGALVVVGTVVALLVHAGGSGPTTSTGTARTPTVESSAGFAAGPILVSVDGRDALQAPGLPMRGASVQPVVLDPAPDVVAVLRAALPGLRDIRGGRIPSDGGRFGVYLAGTYDGDDGSPVTVSLYTVRAPGTTFGTDQFVSRSIVDLEVRVRTDVSVFTGSGWWVHVVSLGPDVPANVRTGEIARLLPLAENPAVVTA